MPVPAPVVPAPVVPASSDPDGPQLLRDITFVVNRSIKGKEAVIEFALLAMVARGHVLIEDAPGVGKSTLARALADALGGRFSRIQFTSDLLPADLIGSSVWRSHAETFEFRPGPLFANVVLADEINRAPPRTQSALLEAMSDQQVSVEGITYPLPQPFTVLATQNPQEHYGTYPLPESQRDRFTMRIEMGYASADVEASLLRNLRAPARAPAAPMAAPTAAPTAETSGIQIARDPAPTEALQLAQVAADQVTVHADLAHYAQRVVSQTRALPGIRLGVSTRGALAWMASARARAYLHGRHHVDVDDLQALAVATLAHRLLSDHETGTENTQLCADLVRDVIASTAVPV